MARDILFIGHANPEDNEFTLWLQAKLINEGYKAECDLSFLVGGEEDYWKNLQELLENDSAKYLLVLSKTAFQKQGVIDEWEQVKGISKRYRLNDFIYILKVDDVAFDVRIGVTTKNHFRFDKSWAFGLKQLFFKLHQDGVPKNNLTPLSVEAWIKNRYSTNQGIVKQCELYYSNWIEIEKLPEKIYFFKYNNDSQAKVIEKHTDFPVVRHDNYIITFSQKLPVHFEVHDFEIAPIKILEIITGRAFQKYDSTEFPSYDDLRRFLVRLLKTVWNNYLVERGLHLYEMSQNTKCFYYLKDQLEKDKVFFKYNNKSTYKQLVGDYFDTTWHYGLSAVAVLRPTLCFSLRSHMLFSDDGLTIWDNKNRLHKARRAKGKSFFNKEWRGLMLAFLASLSDNGKEISIPISEIETLNVPITTMTFCCDYGYDEPKTDGRMVPIDYYEDTEEENNDFEGDNLNIHEDGD